MILIFLLIKIVYPLVSYDLWYNITISTVSAFLLSVLLIWKYNHNVLVLKVTLIEPIQLCLTVYFLLFPTTIWSKKWGKLTHNSRSQSDDWEIFLISVLVIRGLNQINPAYLFFRILWLFEQTFIYIIILYHRKSVHSECQYQASTIYNIIYPLCVKRMGLDQVVL